MPSLDCSAATLDPAVRAAAVEIARSWANAPPVAKVSVATATIAPARRRRSRPRASRASARRARERRLDSSHGTRFDWSTLGTTVKTPWFLGPTGLAVGLALGPALRRAMAAIRPMGPRCGPEWFPRSPPDDRRGLGKVRSYEARQNSEIDPGHGRRTATKSNARSRFRRRSAKSRTEMAGVKRS